MNIIDTLKLKIQKALEIQGLSLSIDEIIIENTKSKEHGDYASNVALKCASRAKTNPRDFAAKLVENIDKSGIEKIEIAGPGFINFFLEKAQINAVISKIIKEDENYGRGEKKDKKINVEFVSANPTGDLHLGHARIGAVGDSICRIYDFAGYDVTREFYINDAGNQVDTLAMSLNIRYHQLFGEDIELPEDSYHASDIIDIAKELKREYGDKYLDNSPESIAFIREYGMKKEFEKIKRDLALFRIHFDVYTSERDIRKNDNVKKVLENDYKDYTYVQDGATFLRTSAFLDDKDRAVVKSDGSYTYMMPDIAYHLNKLERGFDLLIDVLGADHHGYINRMKSALMMKGYNPDQLEIELVQMVRLIKDGEEMKMSKRTGNGITLRELCEDVGVDPVRYFFVSRAASSHLDFDVNLATEKSSSNPVYYAQYAHARLSKMLNDAKDIEFDLEAKNLKEQAEVELIKWLNDFPQVVETSALNREPNLIATYIQKLAAFVHGFYTECRVIDRDNLNITSSRLALVKASQIVLRNALTLIGVSAPEKM